MPYASTDLLCTQLTPNTKSYSEKKKRKKRQQHQLDEHNWPREFLKSHVTNRPGDSHSHHPTMLLLPIAAPAIIRPTTARAVQAVPAEKPVLTKEFKIYHWVCVSLLSVEILTTLNVES
jgi:hypothetical protein